MPIPDFTAVLFEYSAVLNDSNGRSRMLRSNSMIIVDQRSLTSPPQISPKVQPGQLLHYFKFILLFYSIMQTLYVIYVKHFSFSTAWQDELRVRTVW